MSMYFNNFYSIIKSIYSDKISNYFGDGIPYIKQNSSTNDFKRNLHKLYSSSDNKVEYGNQQLANEIQLSIMRRKGNKNLQPRQSQTKINNQSMNLVTNQSSSHITNHQEFNEPYNVKNSYFKNMLEIDKISRSELKPNSEANKKRSMIPDLSGKKLRFAVPDKAIHKSYGNSTHEHISINCEGTDKGINSLNILNKEKSLDKIKKINNMIKKRYNRNSKLNDAQKDCAIQPINLDDDHMLHFPEFKVSKNNVQQSIEITKSQNKPKTGPYSYSNKKKDLTNGESLYQKYRDSMKKHLEMNLDKFKVSQSVDYGRRKTGAPTK